MNNNSVTNKLAEVAQSYCLPVLARLPIDPETAKHFDIDKDRAVSYHSDHEGTKLNYEVISDAVTHLRCEAALPTGWKDRIEEDMRRRK